MPENTNVLTSTATNLPPMILSRICAVMSEVGAVGKDRKNAQQGYNFRSHEDIAAALQPLFAKHKIFAIPEIIELTPTDRPSRGGGVLIYTMIKMRYRFFCADDGSFIEAVVVGEAMDSGDKSANKAMSAAFKYAMIQVFCIPTYLTDDSENDSPEVAGKSEKKAASAQATTKPAADKKQEPKALPAPGKSTPVETTVVKGNSFKEGDVLAFTTAVATIFWPVARKAKLDEQASQALIANYRAGKFGDNAEQANAKLIEAITRASRPGTASEISDDDLAAADESLDR